MQAGWLHGKTVVILVHKDSTLPCQPDAGSLHFASRLAVVVAIVVAFPCSAAFAPEFAQAC